MKKNLLISLLVLFTGTIEMFSQTYYCCQNQEVEITITYPVLSSPNGYSYHFVKPGTGMTCNAPEVSASQVIGTRTYTYKTPSCPSRIYTFKLTCTSLGTYTVYFGYQYNESGCLSNAPHWVEQTSVTVIVAATTVAGSVSGGTTPFCYNTGTTSTGTMTLSGHTGNITKWQKRVNSGSWVDIANTSTTYSEVPSSAGIWDYRAVVTMCGTLYSTAKTITVNANPTAGITPASGSVCPSTNYALAGNPSGGSGTYSTHSWTGTGLTAYTTANTTFNYATPNTYNLSYIVTDNKGCVSNTSNATVTVNPLPSAAGSVTGSASVCQGASSLGYSIASVTNATSYNWTYSGTGATITNGTTRTPTISFSTSATSGTLTAKGVNACGNGASSNVSITVNPLPVAASSITGSATVCQGQSGVSYSINAVTYATSYSWTYSGAGATITNGTTNSPTFAFSTSATSGTITADGVNSCGNGTTSNYVVTVNPLPSAAGAITGSTTVCQGQSAVAYSIPIVTNATSYSWTYSGAGATITNSTTRTPTISFNTSATSGTLTARGVNSCGNGTQSTQAITVNPLPSAAGAITGSATVCQGQSAVSYSIGAITNATSYSWTYSGAGATINGSSTSITIDFSTGATSGNLTIYGINSCGNGSSNVKAITVNPLPSAAGVITGSSTVCQGQNNVGYSVGSITNATSYNWSYSGTGATITDGTTLSPTISFSPTATSGTLTVYGVNACGNGTTNTKAITVNPLPSAAGAVTGSSPVCQGSSGNSYSITAVANATSYSWTYSGTGATITNGTTINPTIGFSTSATSGTLTVYGVNACGNGTSNTKAITISPLPSAAGSITGSATVCQGQSSLSYSISAVSNATSYNWTYGAAGATITNGTTNSPSISFSTGAVSGTLTAYGVNACGNGTSNTKDITVNPLPSAAGAITGSATVCQGKDDVSYSVGAISSATSYIWAYSGTGATFTNSTTMTPTISFSSSATSGNLTVKGTNSCGDGTISANYAITVNAMPATSAITGNTTPACSAAGIVYSVTNTAGSSYAWTVPAGASITAGAGTNSITVTFGTTNGNVSVTETNSGGCPGTEKSLLISLTGCGLDANFIADNTTICEGGSVIFTNTSTGTSGGSTYAWNFGSGASPATASTIGPHTVTYSTGGSKTVSLIVTEGVTNTETKNNFITVNPLPVAAGTVSGSVVACQAQSAVLYSVPAITNATGYVWTYSGTGVTYTNGATNTPTIDFSASATSGNLTVKGTNACGDGTVSAPFSITVNPLPGAAGSITGSTMVCQGQSAVSYSITAVTNATSYTWAYGGTGATITNGATNTPTISFAANATSGVLSVKGTNSCGDGTTSTIFITVNPLPSAAGAITGSASVCQVTSAVSYSIGAITNANSYTWTYSGTGATINGTGTSITIDYAANATSGNLTIYGVNTCGNGSSTVQAITVDPLPAASGTIMGSGTACQGQTGIAYSVGAITNATSYIWTYSGTGATVNGTTNSVTVDINASATSGNITVKGTNACGNGTVSPSLTIIVNPLPGAAGSISGTATSCQGINGIAFNVGTISDATSYTWTYSGTGAAINGTTNSVTTDFGATATSGNITVKGTNTCGNGTASNFAVTINNSPTPKFVISPSAHECAGATMILMIDPQTGQPISNYNFMVNGISKQNSIGNTYVTTELISTDVVTMEATSANTCAKTITATLTIDDKSNGGTLSGATDDICQGSSIGTLAMNSSTGSVVRWEKSSNGGTSWTTIASTSTSYTEDLGIIGSYIYRVVVKNGVCAEANSANSTTIAVHSSTVGGGVTASTETVTLGQNATLNLIANNGSIVKWLTRKAGDVAWTDIVSTSNPLVHAPATADSTWYKAVVQNSVCPSVESTSDYVVVLNPLICVVRYDTETDRNKIVWERTGSNIKSYKIYSVSGTTYTPLATVPFDDFSQYIDMSSDPTSQRHTYSMSTVNTSDVESSKSNVHKTMLLTASMGTLPTDANLIWQPYVDESGKINPDSVFIYKGKTKDAMTLLKGLTYDNTVYIDHAFDGISAYYQLSIKIPVCTPTMKAESGPYAQSLSNIAEYKTTSLVSAGQIPVAVYPNPTSGLFNIEFELDNACDVTIEIISEVGSIEKIISLKNLNAGITTLQLNAKECNLSAGFHLIKVVAGNKVSFVKLGFF